MGEIKYLCPMNLGRIYPIVLYMVILESTSSLYIQIIRQNIYKPKTEFVSYGLIRCKLSVRQGQKYR